MRAFISGASGFIGSHLAAFLLAGKWEVRALMHKSPVRLEGKTEIVRGDLDDRAFLASSLEGVDVLFHLAAALGFSLAGSDEFRRINAAGTENILRAARKAGVRRIVHVSSGGALGVVGDGEAAGEDYPQNPRSVYDRTKLEGEKIALRLAREGSDIVIVRPGWAYGPGDRRTFKLIKSIHGKRFALVAGGRGRQTPVYISDLVRGIALSAEKGRPGEIYHVAGNEILTVKEMAESIASACGTRLPRISPPLWMMKTAAVLLEKTFRLIGKEAPFNRSKLSFFIHPKALSIEKARRELGYEPAVDFETGIALAVDWYKENGWL